MEKRNDRPSVKGRRAVAEMIALQRRIFERQRRIIEANEAHLTSGFTRYRKEYLRCVSGYIAETGWGALCDAVAASRIAYVADYHTLKLAQRTFVKLIKGVLQQVDNICLAVEFVNIEHQAHLDRFLQGRIKESTFLRRIRYREQWPYDIWPGFKPIFELAMDRGLPMIAIDSDPGLPISKRDRLAAKKIAEASQRFSDCTLLVYSGQMHMAPTHLPKMVDKEFVRAGFQVPERVIVYQNAEEIYWQLASARRENVEVVQVDAESYCVNNTPPLVQQLSYLHWIRYDQETLEYRELDSTVRNLIQHLGRFLRIPFRETAKTVRVLMPGDLDLMDALDASNILSSDKQRIIAHAEAEQSACIPELGGIYMATLSLNHAAEEAAHYLKQAVSKGESPVDLKDRFYYHVMNEACGFFGSKVINPKRKTDHHGSLRRIAAGARNKKGKGTIEERAALFVLDHLSWERHGRVGRRGAKSLTDPLVFNAAAHMLGYMLGDRLYYGLTAGTLDKKSIRSLFVEPLDGPDEALTKYLALSELLRDTKVPRRI